MTRNLNTGDRIGSMLIDHFAMTMLSSIIIIPSMIPVFITAFEVTHNPMPSDIFGKAFYFMILGFSLYICKDSFGGRSIGKRALKHQVIDYKTGKVASPLKCLVRNLFIMIWPLEVIITLSTPNRRLGDRVAGTEVVTYEPEREKNNNPILIILAFVISYGLIFTLTYPILTLQSNSFSEPTLNESAYTPTSSNALASILEDHFQQNFTADVKVYNLTDKQANSLYISVILRLKHNIMEDSGKLSMMKNAVEELIAEKFTGKNYSGKINFVYQSNSLLQQHQYNINHTP